jgi:hypothetical protein
MKEGITPRGATKAANALNNTGYLHQMMRAYCLHELRREFYELNSETEVIDIPEFQRLTLAAIGVPAQLPRPAVQTVFRSAANETPGRGESIEADDFARFALFALFNGDAIKRQIDWGEIWREVFKID